MNIIEKEETISYFDLSANQSSDMKPFLNFDQMKNELSIASEINNAQVIIEPIEICDAIDFLKHHNFYSFSIYKKCLPANEVNTFSFNDCKLIYQFDLFLRRNLQVFTGYIENLIKCTIITSLCSNYNGKLQVGECYLDPEIYRTTDLYENFKKMFGSRIYQNKKSLPIKHHIDNKDGHIPLWVIMPELTFGETTKFIDSLTEEVQDNWVDYLFLESQYYKNETSLHPHIKKVSTSWISASWYIRNRTAHSSRLYGLNLNIAHPSFYAPTLRKLKTKRKSDNKDLFSYMLAMKQILVCHDDDVISQWNSFINEIDNKIDNTIVFLRKIGFVDFFKEHLLIE